MLSFIRIIPRVSYQITGEANLIVNDGQVHNPVKTAFNTWICMNRLPHAGPGGDEALTRYSTTY